MIVLSSAEIALLVLLEVIAVDDDGLRRLGRGAGSGLFVRIGLLLFFHDEKKLLRVGRPFVLGDAVVLYMSQLTGLSAAPIEHPYL